MLSKGKRPLLPQFTSNMSQFAKAVSKRKKCILPPQSILLIYSNVYDKIYLNILESTSYNCIVLPLFFDIIKQRDHKYALPSPLTAVEAVKTPVGAVAKNFNQRNLVLLDSRTGFPCHKRMSLLLFLDRILTFSQYCRKLSKKMPKYGYWLCLSSVSENTKIQTA